MSRASTSDGARGISGETGRISTTTPMLFHTHSSDTTEKGDGITFDPAGRIFVTSAVRGEVAFGSTQRQDGDRGSVFLMAYPSWLVIQNLAPADTRKQLT